MDTTYAVKPPPEVKRTPMRSNLKSYEVVEVQNGFIVMPGNRWNRMEGVIQEMFVADTIEEVGKILKQLQAGKEIG